MPKTIGCTKNFDMLFHEVKMHMGGRRGLCWGFLLALLVTGVGAFLAQLFEREKSEWTFVWAYEPKVAETMRIGNWPVAAKDDIGYQLTKLLALPNRARMMVEFSEKWIRYQWKDEDVYEAFGAISYEICREKTQSIVTITVRCVAKDVADRVLEEVKSRLVEALGNDRISEIKVE